VQFRERTVEANDGRGAGVVIVGSGLAGWSLARELRQRAPTLAIRMVCADQGHFYSKPMLSNAFAQKKDADQLVVRAAGQQAQSLNVQLAAGTRVLDIDRENRVLNVLGPAAEDARIRYGTLVLALGADAIRPPTPGIEHALSVNDIDDYRRLRHVLAAAGPGAHIALIGGGLIGSEFANDLVIGGFRVSVIDPAPWPIGNLVSEEQGKALQAALAGLGISFHFGDLAQDIAPRTGGGYRLSLRSGRGIDADVVVSAVGLQPRVELARQAGLAIARGVIVDDMGRTSDPGIYALGDCAAYRSAARAEIASGAPRALPYILPIMAAAKAIAGTLAGQPTAIEFGPMPVRVKTPALPITIAG
jgi:rubredoxin---NAD+ reductase